MLIFSKVTHFCIFFGVVLKSYTTATSCPPIIPKKGVSLECKLPQNDTTLDCESEEIPEGTIASFSCGKYYFREKLPHQGEILCAEDGQWEFLADYDDFHCEIECGVTRRLAPAIVFGSAASKFDFPWHASIFLRNATNDIFDLVCGGSLIDLNNEGPLILTAAHCLGGNLENYRVILGANTSIFLENKDQDSQIFGVSYNEVYPSFNSFSLENDIAVMKLKGNIQLSDAVKPICLERATRTNVGDIGIVAGFGKTEENQTSKNLLYASLPLRTRLECAQKIPKDSKINFPDSKFCVGFDKQDNAINASSGTAGANKIRPGICFGDSGGGLVIFDQIRNRLTLVGIAHAAFKDPHTTCSGFGYFQKVQKYIGWIREVQKIVYPNDMTPSVYEGVGLLGKRCGSNPAWVEYKDEKCFRFVKQLATKAEASKICRFEFAAGNSLPIIKSSEEHEFLIQFLKRNRVTNGVWLGSARGLQGFNWDNGDGMGRFSNWGPNGNSNDQNCSRLLPNTGYWVEEDCGAENLIICEKPQEFSNGELLQIITQLKVNLNESGSIFERIIKEKEERILGLEMKLEKTNAFFEKEKSEFRTHFEEFKRETKSLFKTANTQIMETKSSINEINQKHQSSHSEMATKVNKIEAEMGKIIPVGFLYFQIATQPSPVELWPKYSWKDVSWVYAGLFFRVTGGGAAAMGILQDENAPRLEGVRYSDSSKISEDYYSGIYDIPSSGWSKYIQTGHFQISLEKAYNNETMSFKNSGGEVRPKNTAMRVWKRI